MSSVDLERTSQHEGSPGVVSDDETIVRGAINPEHYNKSGIKAAFVRPAHLLKGELSIWRTTVVDGFGVPEAHTQMLGNLRQGQVLTAIFGAQAGEIRRLRLESAPDEQVFCVVDDCRTDEIGGYHPCHATVGVNGTPEEWQANEEGFSAAVEGLKALLVKKHFWPEAA